MQLTKFPVILLIFITTNMCRAEIAITDPRLDNKTARLAEGVITLLKSCYVDRITPIALAGELPDTLFKKLAVEHSFPVVLIDHPTRTTSNHHRDRHQFRQFRYQLQVFIVGASSVDRFIEIIVDEITPSIWWNNMGSFVILDLARGCNNFVNLLAAAWQIGVLDANVMCISSLNGKRLIFNYNPYTNEAPSPWKRIYVLPGFDNHPFTTFVRTYGKNENICENRHFEKTKNLGGYKIRIFKPATFDIAYSGNLQTSSYLREALNRVYAIISRVMNATLIHNVRPGINLNEALDEIEDVPAGMIDIGHSRMAYPHQQAGVVLISQFRGHKSQLNKILTVIDFPSRCGLGIVYVITFIFFRFFLRQSRMCTILNLVRITCDTGFENIPENNFTRTYLTSLLFFAVTMQGIYQGNLASLLTTQIPIRNVNTWNDIVDLEYNVCGVKSMKLLIDNQAIRERFIEVQEMEHCVECVMNDSSNACIAITAGYMLDQARELKMHVSTENLQTIYAAFHIKWNWPLEQRFNEIIQKMVEADIFKPWEGRFNETKLTEFEYDEMVMKNKDFKNIQLHEVLFAFVILGIGLVGATVTFIGELVVHRFRSRVVTVRVQILNSIQ